MPIAMTKKAIKKLLVDERKKQRSKQRNRSFMSRTRGIYTGQTNRMRKALGEEDLPVDERSELSYTLEDLRELCEEELQHPCRYCHGKLTVKNMTADHAEALTHGGSWELKNLRIVCQHCNWCKGPMGEKEFVRLLAEAKTILSPKSYANFTKRLIIGGKWLRGE